uniref:leucine-rich repeat receptor protein kinase HPCA1-like n=1 Tax=Erigeron canadensis TaxID=72917 RepID=UPI001CB9351C|nr:leucine-rich repeat receptor protein kinase HPCA1-like [Erigeron canadensis]
MVLSIRLWVLIIVCSQILVVFAARTDPNDLGVLKAIKSSWRKLPLNWRGSDPCGRKWEGVNCTNSRVTTLKLAGIGLKTKDIGDISSLSMLVYLDLSNNKGIKAVLPQSIQNLQNLTTLMLVGCSFRGRIPDSIGSLKSLVFLALNYNNFTGSIPPSIGNLSNLTWLDLTHNQLTGSIPVSNGTALGLDMLLNAKHFHLGNNQLSGPIQSRLFHANMTLKHFIINNNQLNGTIPSSIGLLPTLQTIRLDSNILTGTVPQNITNLKSVRQLHLSNNFLTGPIPNLAGMNNLTYVDMSNNSFDTSDIPPWFTISSLTTLLMDKTQISGVLPSNVFQFQLERLELSNNNLDGTLDIGNSYSSDLIVNLTYNSIVDFTQKSVYNLSLDLSNNPVCEGGARRRYCPSGNTKTPIGSPPIGLTPTGSPPIGLTPGSLPISVPPNNCPSVRCGSNKMLSIKCKCTNPYTGNIYFLSYTFSNLDNQTYYATLLETFITAFRVLQLPVESISFSSASINEFKYITYRLHIFPSDEDFFNRSSVSLIGNIINGQLDKPYYGPMIFLGDNYCCFPEDKSSNKWIIICATIGSFLIVLLALAMIYAIYQKRHATKEKQDSPFASWGLNNGSDAGAFPQLKGARWYSFEELKQCTNNFSEENIIGSGGYGKVYKGILNNGQLIAIKRARQGSLHGAQEFKTEIELLSRIHHKNVVALVGFCYEEGEQMLVYEYISNGTLKENLSGKTGIRLNWMWRLRVALDSAKGLTYLHELANPPIIHRDIKSNNILLDHHLNAKVADFGLSKLLGEEGKGYVSTQVKGTLGYMDPEYYTTQQLTEKSDVYSFGVVLLELLTARSPIRKGKYIVKEVSEVFDKSGDPNGLYNILDPCLGSPETLGGLTKFVNLAMSCVKASGAQRPNMGEVVREIESIIDLAALSMDSESSFAFSSQNTRKGDLYDPYSDTVTDVSSLSVPFETELRR